MADNGIERALGRIEGKLDGLIASVNHQRGDIENQRKRVNALERWRTGVHYVAAFVVSIAAAVVAYFKQG